MTPEPTPGNRDGAAPSFWDRVRIPRFRSAAPRVILFTSGYFLQREITSACARLSWEVLPLPLPPGGRGETAFLESLLTAAATFGPDFALTVNHLGLDSQGELAALFARMALPLASWFVDSPRLILHDYPGQANPWLAAFTWDRDTVPMLSGKGFGLSRYLPLATDTTLFKPGAPGKKAWNADVSFVGDSMVRPCAKLLERLALPPATRELAARAALGFARSHLGEALDAMRSHHPELYAAWQALPRPQDRLDLEQYVTWEATRLYRLERVRALLPLSPLIAGDPGWRELLPRGGWRLQGPLDYYRDLPGFYGRSLVNCNATSLQMKQAVNQRVFDVPACGGFLLTDRRGQMDDLFEEGRETVVYSDPGDIAGMAGHYLKNAGEREKIAAAARGRVLAEHDYTHRMKDMLRALRRRYA